MPPPTPLAIKTSSVTRLIKEESSYRKETLDAQAAVAKLESSGADEYELRQPKQVLEQTLAMRPEVRKWLDAAVRALAQALSDDESAGKESTEVRDKAEKALEEGRKVLEGEEEELD